MRPETVSFLLDLNRQFYQQFGPAFAATRQRIQPGVRRLLERFQPLRGRWLDLGSGNGELARELGRRGFEGEYSGLDFSQELINLAIMGSNTPHNCQINFLQSDLSNPHWSDSFTTASFDIVLALAVLHHLPGEALRLKMLCQARRLLRPGGLLIHSEWQFQNSPKLLARLQPWEKVGLSLSDLDEGDALLDWRYNLPGQPQAAGQRYVHRFNLEELARLAETCGFRILETFESDGQGGKLGLYQVWAPV